MTNLHDQKKKYYFYTFVCTIVGLLIFFGLVVFSDNYVSRVAEGKMYDSIERVPRGRVGLLLGTGKFASGGRINLFYQYRIDAILSLYQAEKIEYVLISGDNSVAEYNEPETMRDDLILSGIPNERIFLDYAGFRTWDSIIRANKVFGESDFIIVTQRFHNERALFIAEKNGINAIGFNAKSVPVAFSPRVWLRERLARVNVIFDVLVGSEPKFLGDMISIE